MYLTGAWTSEQFRNAIETGDVRTSQADLTKASQAFKISELRIKKLTADAQISENKANGSGGSVGDPNEARTKARTMMKIMFDGYAKNRSNGDTKFAGAKAGKYLEGYNKIVDFLDVEDSELTNVKFINSTMESLTAWERDTQDSDFAGGHPAAWFSTVAAKYKSHTAERIVSLSNESGIGQENLTRMMDSEIAALRAERKGIAASGGVKAKEVDKEDIDDITARIQKAYAQMR
jgi:hypothetical protein